MLTTPAGWFLILSGLWLARTGLQASDTRWSRLTMNWPVPWPLMAEPARRRVRFGATLLGSLFVAGGVAILRIAWRAAAP